MNSSMIKEFSDLMDHSLEIELTSVKVLNPEKVRKNIYKLAQAAALETGEKKNYACYLMRLVAMEMGTWPASINELYLARGRGDVPSNFTVPAINLRQMTFDMSKVIFKTAKPIDATAILFEIARSEMGYCDQKPAEFTAAVLAGAISEGYTGPVFIQGDHFQLPAKKYLANPDAEMTGLKKLIDEAVAAGYYNIDVDTSTLVDIEKPTIVEQQKLNVELSVKLAAYIRSVEPKGVTISIGGEIGEVGGHNSTEEELHAYLDGFNKELKKIAPGAVGISKISIQTGTSHGGVVLPDGSIAKVSVDFDTIKNLSRVSRKEYGLGGAVQHGASTLPEDAFGQFVDNEACEVHLATNFMTMYYDNMPASLRSEMYAWLDKNNSADKKPDMTSEQFYYKMRKNALGPFKKQSWLLPEAEKSKITTPWEVLFKKLFNLLAIKGTRQYTDKFIKPVLVKPDIKAYMGASVDLGDVKDLAD